MSLTIPLVGHSVIPLTSELTVSTRGEETAHPQTTVILTMAAMSGPRIFVGKESHPVTTPAVRSRGPVTPVENGDGTIFVSIPSYRDGERCGETLKALFENAKNPDKIFVGLVEQNNAEDKFCMEQYCSSYGKSKLITVENLFRFL
jgi:hypothetical protein